MARRNRLWDLSHVRIPLSKSTMELVRKHKKNKTYDEFFGSLLKEMDQPW